MSDKTCTKRDFSNVILLSKRALQATAAFEYSYGIVCTDKFFTSITVNMKEHLFLCLARLLLMSLPLTSSGNKRVQLMQPSKDRSGDWCFETKERIVSGSVMSNYSTNLSTGHGCQKSETQILTFNCSS